ncbi:ATP-binding protein [Massilia timonae]|uniref:ATP-binding protein n=1 Tax=Massilia timonae TaxID=47229 RepID=UPI00289C9AD2|nr:ATP-binding protein [Massilia timonae]
MNRLVHALAHIVRTKVVEATQGLAGRLESRFIFHGPPLGILERVFEELARDGGILVPRPGEEPPSLVPVLLQLPAGQLDGANPAMGRSGKCDEGHLLDIRNDPGNPSFVALVPPGQFNNRSVTSTTEEFGIGPASNSAHANFEDWWNDPFVQDVLDKGLKDAGLERDAGTARHLAGHAAEAVDDMDREKGSRRAAWRLLSRIYSIPDSGATGVRPGHALALACGVPPMADGTVSRRQSEVLGNVAQELAEGFRTGTERLANGAGKPARQALEGFLAHVQASCDVPTAFQRATQAFYLPSDCSELQAPPAWWSYLSAECWAELLSEGADGEEAPGELSISCTNAIIPAVRGIPAIVRDRVELLLAIDEPRSGEPVQATLLGGSHGKEGKAVVISSGLREEDVPPEGSQKSPISYKVQSDGRKPATAKIISLATWAAGIVVTARMASKLSPPRKPRNARAGVDWESSLSLPGSGRYELLLLAPPGTSIVEAACIPDDATEVLDRGRRTLGVHKICDGEYQVEIEADGKYQLDVAFRRPGSNETETCTVLVTCEEAREEGCRSEFERLIKRNRQHIDRLDGKSVVQLDRNGRLSSLQGWLLDERYVERSFVPIVLADDYGSVWAPPDWTGATGPILSKAQFLQDPRPDPSRFCPPPGFVEARKAIAARIRESADAPNGLVESSPLGKWLARDDGFKSLMETYLDSYASWLASDRDIACWVDAIAVCGREAGGRTLARVPDAIILSPLHPLRLAWHCLAQQVLFQDVEGDGDAPCPAASILDPDCVPDAMTILLQSPVGSLGLDPVDFISVESNSDYWSVLWNGSRLAGLPARSQLAPFDNTFGLKVGGISGGFSPAQVGRALEDVSDLLAAKPVISVVVSGDGGTTDACNEGLAAWCTRRFGSDDRTAPRQGVGPKMVEVYDTRPPGLRPDQATIANLSEDTRNLVRWFEKRPQGARPDLGIIAQLDSTQPESADVGIRSPLGLGGLIRHRVRRQLNGSFLSESRQARPTAPTGDAFPDKVAACIMALEGAKDKHIGLRFAPDVHAVSNMLEEHDTGFVAVSSSAIDPACFLGGWIPGTYLWDYDLPSYSHRAGDTNGYYLLSRVKVADREALARVMKPILGGSPLDDAGLGDLLLEVARRGIPTVRGLSGDDTGATGDLGLFLAARLLQDQFRPSGNAESLLPVLSGTEDDASLALVIPVDPFRGYLADLARSLGNRAKDMSLSRPDLLVVGVRVGEHGVRIHLTPVEVKCRQGTTLSSADAKDALGQAQSLSLLLRAMQERAARSVAWKLALQHLLLSMVGFGLRVYSQHHLIAKQQKLWATYHERIAASILEGAPTAIGIDDNGRLIVVDDSPESAARDHDGDGLSETIVISPRGAREIIVGDAQAFYDKVRAKVGDWDLLPEKAEPSTVAVIASAAALVDRSNQAVDAGHARPVAVAANGDPAPDTVPTVPTVHAASPNEAQQPVSGQCGGIRLSAGRSVDGFEPRQFALNISDTRLNQLNIGVVGDLGTGKTQLLKSLIFQIARAREENRGIKPRFLIFDYKRDYSSPDFVAATGAKVVKPRNLPLNLFDTTPIADSSTPWLDRFRFFADVLDKVYTGIGPVQRDKLKGAVRNAYESCKTSGDQPTIYDIHAEYRELLAGKSDTPMAIIDDLVDMEIFERDTAKTESFDEFMDGVVVVSLDALGQDDRSKNMLVAIMLNMFYENMLRTPKRLFQGTDPQLRVIDSYLLVDEADNIMRYEFDVLRKLLLQGREFGAGVILASQYLRHFKAGATDYREPLLTWFIHKVPNVAASELGALGFTSDLGDLAERVKTLPNHHCLYKSFHVAGEVIRGTPFYELAEGK